MPIESQSLKTFPADTLREKLRGRPGLPSMCGGGHQRGLARLGHFRLGRMVKPLGAEGDGGGDGFGFFGIPKTGDGVQIHGHYSVSFSSGAALIGPGLFSRAPQTRRKQFWLSYSGDRNSGRRCLEDMLGRKQGSTLDAGFNALRKICGILGLGEFVDFIQRHGLTSVSFLLSWQFNCLTSPECAIKTPMSNDRKG